MRKAVPVFTALAVCLLALSCAHPDVKDDAPGNVFKARLKKHSAEIKKYAAQKKASTTFAILIDMSLPSDKKRLFVVDLNTDSILVSGLCAHGQGSDYTKEEVVFSNVPGSLCTSEGRYKVGYKYNGQWGWAYKLHGLDSTNSNAFARTVVFHYYSCVSDFEDQSVCRSSGCPMVSENTFKAAAKLIDASKQPVLMWVYR